ncbi:hypothetical protein H8B09_27945 [Paenibacillus sp. PR3]|uniref:Uncharacterized protein n=1 Tax=Paenibacillus terricola TaxID=2763503 RepID=A0ABR8N4X1_9BACL|nr:hypothetical protein [Paenibacillus terricola]MBD3922591.1 hypothetical protein [Paenibacillus terricola]
MRPNLILIEGLPGSGKSTTAQLVHEIMKELNIHSQLILEGNLDHPADYDGVAYFNKVEYDELLNALDRSFRDLVNERTIRLGDNCFLEYRKLFNELGSVVPDDLRQACASKDIYELSLGQNRKLIVDRWKQFAERAVLGSDTYIFECCFIQNPVTMGMIKYGADEEDVVSYVLELASAAEKLNPLLIYVDQNDLDHSFRKAVDERPQEWSEGFIDYYTNQGYGKRQGYEGLEGTIHVLNARSELEQIIFNRLSIAKMKVNNSSFDRDHYKRILTGIITERMCVNG